MGFSLNPAGEPVFSDTFNLPGDLTAAVDYAKTFAYARGGTSVERQALPAAQRKTGMLWSETDTPLVWRDHGTTLGWKLLSGRVVAHAKRAATSTTFGTSYLDLSSTTYWDQVTALGFEPYANGWKIPYTGRYLVSCELRANGTFLSGVAVNQANASNPTLQLVGTSSSVQTIAAVTSSGPITLNAGDVVRPYIVGVAASAGLRSSEGFFSVELLGGV